jgi:hypothetical protein
MVETMTKDLAGQDLRNQDLSERTMFGVDLRGAKLYGAKVSLKCEQFDGVKLDDDQMAQLLLMIAESDTDVNTGWYSEIHQAVRSCLGRERYQAHCRLLRLI